MSCFHLDLILWIKPLSASSSIGYILSSGSQQFHVPTPTFVSADPLLEPIEDFISGRTHSFSAYSYRDSQSDNHQSQTRNKDFITSNHSQVEGKFFFFFLFFSFACSSVSFFVVDFNAISTWM